MSREGRDSQLLRVVFFFSSRRRHTRYWRDWSSDVCSSDLGSLEKTDDGVRIKVASADSGEQQDTEGEGGSYGGEDAPTGEAEIGRASCRERVKISVVAVSLKKTK